MPNIDLDFAVQGKAYPLAVRLFLLLLGVVSCVALAWWQHQLQTRLMAQQALLVVNAPSAQSSTSPAMQETLNYAEQTLQSLNFPWLPMLSNLERVKAAHPHIQLLSVQPNKNKLEVLLTGEAQTFDQITQFLTALKASPAFNDAMLLNQQLIVENEKQVIPTYTFSMQLNWRGA